MPNIAPFRSHTARYDAWFDRHREAYVSELLALRACVPLGGRGVEIGVGTGRFAAPLGITVGIEPCSDMARIAVRRGINTVGGIAESLPFPDNGFDFALVVTTICFVDSPVQMLAEASRVLKPDGRLIIGFIDRDSVMGRLYEAHKADNVFYRDATFYSADEVGQLLRQADFQVESWTQTLGSPLAETREIEAAQPGRGRCAFVVVAARNGKRPD